MRIAGCEMNNDPKEGRGEMVVKNDPQGAALGYFTCRLSACKSNEQGRSEDRPHPKAWWS